MLYLKKFFFMFIWFVLIFSSNTTYKLEQKLRQDGFVFIPETQFLFGGYKTALSHIVFLPSFWVCNHKITVGEYKSFIDFYNAKNDIETVNTLLPQNKDYIMSVEYKDPVHYDDPVRYVSASQVEKYCAWKTEQDSGNIVYSLISEEQWECIASEAANMKCENDKIIISQNKTFDAGVKKKSNGERYSAINFFNISENTYEVNKNIRITHYKKYSANKYGVYDIFGNCREITSTFTDKKHKNCIAKGAFYGDAEKNIKIENRFVVEYNKGYFNYGFRIVANIKNI